MSKSIFFPDFLINSIFLMIDFRFKSIIKIGMIGIISHETKLKQSHFL